MVRTGSVTAVSVLTVPPLDCMTRKVEPDSARSSRAEVATHDRRKIGVNHRRRRSFILPVLRKNLRRQRDRHLEFFQSIPDLEFVRRVLERKQKRYRNRLYLCLSKLRHQPPEIARFQLDHVRAVVKRTLAKADPKRIVNQRWQTACKDVVEIRAGLASDDKDVFKTGRRHQRGPGAFAFQQGVGGHSRSVNDLRNISMSGRKGSIQSCQDGLFREPAEWRVL